MALGWPRGGSVFFFFLVGIFDAPAELEFFFLPVAKLRSKAKFSLRSGGGGHSTFF